MRRRQDRGSTRQPAPYRTAARTRAGMTRLPSWEAERRAGTAGATRRKAATIGVTPESATDHASEQDQAGRPEEVPRSQWRRAIPEHSSGARNRLAGAVVRVRGWPVGVEPSRRTRRAPSRLGVPPGRVARSCASSVPVSRTPDRAIARTVCVARAASWRNPCSKRVLVFCDNRRTRWGVAKW